MDFGPLDALYLAGALALATVLRIVILGLLARLVARAASAELGDRLEGARAEAVAEEEELRERVRSVIRNRPDGV